MTRLMCPTCRVTPSRTQMGGGRPARCLACHQATLQAKWRATADRRKDARPRAFLCPCCKVQPPRQRPAPGGSAMPLCQACFDARWSREYTRKQSCADDIPAAEIERRYQFALTQIRRRHAWTLAHGS